eukprot:3109351-Pleurochrysis_carterae.AAC.2
MPAHSQPPYANLTSKAACAPRGRKSPVRSRGGISLLVGAAVMACDQCAASSCTVRLASPTLARSVAHD